MHENFRPTGITWNILDPDEMQVVIKQDGQLVMKISVIDIIESCSRKKVLQHVKDCDNTPWLKRWQVEKHEALIDILRKD